MPTSELGRRIVTGVIGAAALLALVIFGGSLGIYLLVAVLAFGMTYEFTDITLSMSDKLEKRYLLLFVTWFVIVIDLFAPRMEFVLFVLCFLALFTYFLVGARRHVTEAELGQHFRELMYSIFGLLYLGFLPLYLARIHDFPNGVHWTIVFFLIVWAGDTGAYFAGKKYGRRKLYELISPKKTIEGAIGGLAAGFVVCLLYKLVLFRNMGWFAVIVLPLLVGAVAQIGDLCESFLKRAFARKDSGSILPGHGGFLDRFDGVVFALPVMYACIRVFS